MSLTSVAYLAFLLACTLLTYLVKAEWQNHVLLLFSIGFIAMAMPKECIVLMLIVLTVYFAGIIIGATDGVMRAVMFVVTTVFIVGMLYLYKYSGLEFVLPYLGGISIVAPLGLSYVSLQCISYLAEIRRGKIRPETNPVNFMLYALFFAKLTAGPIETPKDFFASIGRSRRFSRANAENGLALIAVGFIKKIAIANVLAPMVDKAYSTNGLAGAIPMITATLLYSAQLLADFSGYTDIARGSAMILGIRLTENFSSPYSATSVRDFWRRWHISLSSWLRDYIYIPLGGSRCSMLQRFSNIIITFVVSGIWHGAGLNFIFWGALHAVYQIIEILTDPVMKKLRALLKIKEDGILHTTLARIRTFIFVAFAWIFFRAPDLNNAFKIVTRIFTRAGSFSYVTETMGLSVMTAVLVLAAFAAERLLKRKVVCRSTTHNYRLTHSPERYVCLIVLVAVTIFVLYLASAQTGGSSSFIYMDF